MPHPKMKLKVLENPIEPKPPEIFADVLRKHFPEQMKEFEDAPWDYKIFFPVSFEDVPEMSVYLHIGKKKCEKEYLLKLPLR